MKVLLVDDSESVRGFLREELMRLGCEVEEAEDGYEALERLHADEPPQAAFVDRQMPLMDGPALIRAVRAEPRFAAMRIVFCAPPYEVSGGDSAAAPAIDYFLPKPITRSSVVKALDALRAPAGRAASC